LIQKGLRVDGHTDWPYYMMREGCGLPFACLSEGPFTVQRAAEGGVRLFGTALYCEDAFNGPGSAGVHLDHLLALTLERLQGLSILKARKDLEALQTAEGVLGTFLILENADALADDPARLTRLRYNGVLLVGLTHAGSNRLAQGNGIETASGLTGVGHGVLDEIKRLGLAVDVAHLHPRCFWELVGSFDGPLVDSHTGIRDLCPLRRNLDLDQAREIMIRGGVVGVTFNPEMLTASRPCGLEDIFRHVDLLVQTFGPDGVALGSDFFGFDNFCQGMEHIGHLERLARIMASHGYTATEVEQIMGGNWVRFLRELLTRPEACA